MQERNVEAKQGHVDRALPKGKPRRQVPHPAKGNGLLRNDQQKMRPNQREEDEELRLHVALLPDAKKERPDNRDGRLPKHGHKEQGSQKNCQ